MILQKSPLSNYRFETAGADYKSRGNSNQLFLVPKTGLEPAQRLHRGIFQSDVPPTSG